MNIDNLILHIMGSSNPKGAEGCKHSWEYNDDTMGGCGSGWDRRCTTCGKVEYE